MYNLKIHNHLEMFAHSYISLKLHITTSIHHFISGPGTPSGAITKFSADLCSATNPILFFVFVCACVSHAHACIICSSICRPTPYLMAITNRPPKCLINFTHHQRCLPKTVYTNCKLSQHMHRNATPSNHPYAHKHRENCTYLSIPVAGIHRQMHT